jgi:hypothetical protein
MSFTKVMVLAAGMLIDVQSMTVPILSHWQWLLPGPDPMLTLEM